jgi:hypothetical protein
VRLTDLGAPLNTAQDFATLNVASPLVQDYTATADQITDLDLTAPGTITTEAGLIYRKQDASNYWREYFDVLGAYRVDSVAAGTPTNRTNVAAVIAVGQTRTIRVSTHGNLHDHYTFSGTTPSKRGNQLSFSTYAAEATVQPDIGAGWTAANLRSYPRISSNYDGLDAV